ncbi:MAG: hypothetical protein ACT4OG_06325 [Alphaproteobacteria bacterium]
MSNLDTTASAAREPPASLDSYHELVNTCARLRLNFQIANGSAVHARILISKLFEIARREVLLISGTVREASDEQNGVEIYPHPPVIEQAQRFLRLPNTSLSILVQTGTIDRGQENRFLNAIINDEARVGIVKILQPKKGSLSTDETPHFMVSDRAAYRFETGRDATPTNTGISAVANFGDTKGAKGLGELFDEFGSLLETPEYQQRICTFETGARF